MGSLRLRACGIGVVGAMLLALAAGTASAGSTIGLLDVSKQVAKIQQQVIALTDQGE